MSRFEHRFRLILFTTSLALGVAMPGCAFRADIAHLIDQKAPVPADDSSAHGLARSGTSSVASATDPKAAKSDPNDNSDRALLTRGDWTRILSSPSGFTATKPDKPQASIRRWQHSGVDELVARSTARRAEFTSLLSDADPVVATNAAIAMARLGNKSVEPNLAKAVRTPDLRMNARCAAVEALASLPGPETVETMRSLIDRYGEFAPGSANVYQPSLHVEMIHALAQHVEASDDPRFAAALGSPSVDVRIEVLQAWERGHRGIVPLEVADLRNDADPRVRAAAILALAARRHPESARYLDDALRDIDLQVRLAAIDGLARVDSGKSRATLADLLKDRSERIRAAAVVALARSGARSTVIGAESDASWRVRLMVAQALAAYADRAGAAVAVQFLDDQSAEVQRQAVLSLVAWPLELSGPILLEAMSRPALTTRRAAAEQLKSRWPPSAEFPVEALAPRRAECLAQLQSRFRREVLVNAADSSNSPNSQNDPLVRRASADSIPAPAIDPATLDSVERLIAGGKKQELIDFGSSLVPALERIALDRNRPLPEMVYHEVLPPRDPSFAALDRLRSTQPEDRRRASEELASIGRRQPIGRLATARLCELVVMDPDEAVWRGALDAIRLDAGEPAIRLAHAALGHKSEEIRRRGCDYLTDHPDPSHVRFLLPLLKDNDHAVLVAAIRALSAVDALDDLAPLRALLAVNDGEIQFETAIGLIRHHDASGAAALERLSYSDDPKIRARVALAMGDGQDRSCLPALIRLLDDRRATVTHAALASLPRIVGSDIALTGDGAAPGVSEQVYRWKKWFADGQRSP